MFGKKKETNQPSETVRADQVRRLRQRSDDEIDAILYDVDGCPDYPRARAAYDAARRNSSAAEIRAAHPHGG